MPIWNAVIRRVQVLLSIITALTILTTATPELPKAVFKKDGLKDNMNITMICGAISGGA